MQSNLNRNFFIVSTFALANLKMLQDLQVLYDLLVQRDRIHINNFITILS